MSQMFYYSSFNQDITEWDTRSVETMYQMFAFASSFNQDISGWNTNSVNNIFYMFGRASSFDQNLSNWDVSGITDSGHLLIAFFRSNVSCDNADSIITSWNAQNSNATSDNLFGINYHSSKSCPTLSPTLSPTVKPDPPKDTDDSSLSDGAIIGIVIGGIVFVSFLVYACYVQARKKPRESTSVSLGSLTF